MPTINVFSTADSVLKEFDEITEDLKTFLANELSGSAIKLGNDEISVRLIKTTGSGMLAEAELEITAHAFKERVDRQDDICLKVRQFLKQRISADELRVWLLLPELGHSWE